MQLPGWCASQVRRPPPAATRCSLCSLCSRSPAAPLPRLQPGGCPCNLAGAPATPAASDQPGRCNLTASQALTLCGVCSPLTASADLLLTCHAHVHVHVHVHVPLITRRSSSAASRCSCARRTRGPSITRTSRRSSSLGATPDVASLELASATARGGQQTSSRHSRRPGRRVERSEVHSSRGRGDTRGTLILSPS